MEGLTLDAGLSAVQNDGLQELVVLALFVAFLDGSHGVTALLALALNHTLQGQLDSLPPLVTVHGVVAANNGSQLASANLLDVVQKLLQVCCTGLGVGVTAIAEEVDVYLGDLVLLGSLEQRIEVLLLGVLLEIQSAHCFVIFLGLKYIPHRRGRPDRTGAVVRCRSWPPPCSS